YRLNTNKHEWHRIKNIQSFFLFITISHPVFTNLIEI
ncbi:hypothetical protein LCGC14_2931620, partial [marine sediment metagenome]